MVAPALPISPVQYGKVHFDSLNNVLRLYFNRLDVAIGYLLGQAPISVKAYHAATGAYTIAATDYLLECTTGTFTVTLPSAVTTKGQEFEIKNSGTGVITVATVSSQTIDGDTTKLLVQYDAMKIMSNGTNWMIV